MVLALEGYKKLHSQLERFLNKTNELLQKYIIPCLYISRGLEYYLRRLRVLWDHK